MAKQAGRSAFEGPQLPVRRVEQNPDSDVELQGWPYTMPVVQQVLRDGLDLSSATILIGSNGIGKSTLVEAIAMSYGMPPEGGSTGARHSTFGSESSLFRAVRIIRGIGASRWGYFIRGETLHGLYTYLHHNPGFSREPEFHAMSHGESFSTLMGTKRFVGPDFFVMDEPEAGLSFDTLLGLLVNLRQMMDDGAQVLIATHSPILAALPGATVLELDGDGIHETSYEDLAMVNDYRRFLDAPERYFRHLFSD